MLRPGGRLTLTLSLTLAGAARAAARGASNPDPKPNPSRCGACCGPGGVLVFDTINRSYKSYLLTIVLAQERHPPWLHPPSLHSA